MGRTSSARSLKGNNRSVSTTIFAVVTIVAAAGTTTATAAVAPSAVAPATLPTPER